MEYWSIVLELLEKVLGMIVLLPNLKTLYIS